MKLVRKKILCFLLISLVLSHSIAFADVEGASLDEIVKDYEFTSSDKNSIYYDAPKSITEDEIEYELINVTYEVIKEIEPQKIEREVSVNNLEDFKSEIKEPVNGEEVTFKAETPKWEKEEIPREQIIREEYRTYRGGEVIPSEIAVDGDRFIETSMREETVLEPFSTPAYFTSTDINNPLYSFNGKIVEISGPQPYWEGWEADVMEYLNLSSSDITIDTISWNGDFEGEEGNYTREALVSGRETAYNYIVTYTYDSERELSEEDIEYLYTAKVTYVEEKEPSYEVVAHATYSPIFQEEQELIEQKGLTLIESLGIGAGVAALSGAGAYLFFFLGKKRKTKQE